MSDAFDCRAARAALSARRDGELEARSADELLRHLSGCQACRAHERALERLAPGLAALRAAAPPGDLWRRIEQRLPAAPATRRRSAIVSHLGARAAAALVGFAGLSALALALERRPLPAAGSAVHANPLAQRLAVSAGDTGFLDAQPELLLLRQPARAAREPR